MAHLTGVFSIVSADTVNPAHGVAGLRASNWHGNNGPRRDDEFGLQIAHIRFSFSNKKLARSGVIADRFLSPNKNSVDGKCEGKNNKPHSPEMFHHEM
jgi:hypothetical protein